MDGHCKLYGQEGLPCQDRQDDEFPTIATELKYPVQISRRDPINTRVIHSQIPLFQQTTPPCTTILQGHGTASGQPHPARLQSVGSG